MLSLLSFFDTATRILIAFPQNAEKIAADPPTLCSSGLGRPFPSAELILPPKKLQKTANFLQVQKNFSAKILEKNLTKVYYILRYDNSAPNGAI
ncbi:MAG: hypothetical protein NC299_12090 [Lachnospiraceae bacterium]|nr:hypothetical protein [Lachnospiraceae bacterium]